jgi:multiple sugar transport system substrate-binding protein
MEFTLDPGWVTDPQGKGDMIMRGHSVRRMNRRQFVAGTGAVVGAAALAACTSAPPAPTPQPSQPNSAPPAAATPVPGGAAASGGGLTLPNSGAKLPTEPLTLRWADNAGLKAVFFKDFLPAYQKAHPNITVAYDGLPLPELAKVVPLGIQNGNAPDVFELPTGFTGAQSVAQGWAQPLDELIPNFAEWKASYPAGIFVNGNNVFNGKTYSFPFVSNKKNNALLHYNVEYLKQASIDPTAKVMSWEEFRAAAKKLTQQGAGKYFGFLVAAGEPGRMAMLIRLLAQMAGASGGEMNWKTGEYNYASDQFVAAVDLLLALKADGSIFPGAGSLNALQADDKMPQGVAALMINGSYMIPNWRTSAPDFVWDIVSQPVPDGKSFSPLTYSPGGNVWWVYARSKYPEVAGDMLGYLGSEVGQTAFQQVIAGAQPSVFAKANQAAGIDPLARKAAALYDQQMRLGPIPNVRNPAVAEVDAALKPLTPDFGTTIQGLYTGQLTDPKKTLVDLKDRADKELERAIKAAQDKGAKVSRDDYRFPNWDPTRDFLETDYK